MDRTWILLDDRLSREYSAGIESFVDVSRNHLNENNECRCPCRRCANRSFAILRTIRAHLMRFEFKIRYDVWICHGEKEIPPSTFLAGSSSKIAINEYSTVAEHMKQDDDVLGPLLEDLAKGVENEGSETPFMGTNQSSFFGDSVKKLYTVCLYSTLVVVILLMHIKVVNRWRDKSFDTLLSFIQLLWPNLNKFLTTMYHPRKRLRDVGLGYEKIDACTNDCCLFWKTHANDDRSHICGESRYRVNSDKGKKIPHKSLRYFPITTRLQRLFLCGHTAKDMIWHKDKKDESSDVLRLPPDGEAWKHFDETYTQFTDDPRSMCLGLATDEFSLFSSSYSMRPIIFISYNMPHWKCMQQPFFMLSLLISGLTSPGKDIDLYLRPLIDELKDLWNVGVDTYDAASNSRFQLHTTLLWTINDFPAYGNLSGWSIHGKMACPICMEDTTSVNITSKICYMGHLRWLTCLHTWRRSKLYDGKVEHRPRTKTKTGEEILSQVEQLPPITFRKHSNNKYHKRKRTAAEQN